MADNSDQKRAEDMPPSMQQNSLGISISPHLRRRVIVKIIDTLNKRCTEPGTLLRVETIAQKLEEQVLAVASDEQDYLSRIASRIKPRVRFSQKAPDSLIPSVASIDPNQFNSGNVQLTDIKHDEQRVESKDASQLEPFQIIDSNSPSFTATTPIIQNSDLLNILEKKDPIPIPVPVQLPCSQKTDSRVSRQHIGTEHRRHSGVTKQQYESWQRDMAHQSKVIPIPSQHKSLTFLGKHEASQPQRSTAQISGNNDELKKLGTLLLKNVSSEATMRIDTSSGSAVERLEDAQVWRDNTHRRIMAMKKMYQPELTAADAKLDDRLKQINRAKVMVGRMLRSLNVSKDEIMPGDGEKLDNWEQFIVSYLSMFPKTALPQQTLSPTVRPTEETVAGASLLPTRNADNDQRNSDLSPVERLLKAVTSISPEAFKSAMDDIFSVTTMVDMMEPSAPNPTAKGALGHDLGAMTWCRLQARNPTKTWTPRPFLTDNHLKKRHRNEPALTPLSDEIRNVNQRLIDIQVRLCNTNLETVVKCYYIGVSVDLSFIKSIKPSAGSSLIQPLAMLVPKDYPDCSPKVLDNPPTQNVEFGDNLSDEARARLDKSLLSLHSPATVSDIARTWELCARAVVVEYAQKFGGGSFSSRYGKWDNCLDNTAAS
ncbi:hypothetical protein RND81_03G135800 [Saponaria officinalis]|uniref:Mediator complex subunit 15 KIX domain-containing protein n=1 Tax=Saponaria officinalis TaxID=3572 RepID=A0AAW1M6Y5_SAPOF